MKKFWTLLLAIIFVSTCCLTHDGQPDRAPSPEPSCRHDVECLFDDAFEAASARYPHLQKPGLRADPLVPNAAYRAEENEVLYWDGFLRGILHEFGYPAVAGVLAHELGHAVCITQLSTSSEVCADVAAGCILNDMHLPLAPLQEWLRTTEGGDDYPPGEMRAHLVEMGAQRCRIQDEIPKDE